MSAPRIVIVGGGFGGLQLARSLKDAQADVLLMDKNNYHTFQPLLYQVATAGLEPDSIAYPFREIFRDYPRFTFRMGELKEVLPSENRIRTSVGDLNYDYLVLALGSVTNYFGVKDFEKFTHPMKSVPQAAQLRNIILENMEKALVADPAERQALMTMVIIGGGPTGVEMAGALGELKNHVLHRDYPDLDVHSMHIHLVDMADRLLNAMSQESSQSAYAFLKKFNIELSLKAKVLDYDGKTLKLSNGKKIETQTVIWAAGVAAPAVAGIPKEDLVHGGRIKVDAFNRISSRENIFVIGDAACMVTSKTPKGHPMLAPVAIQQARNLAQNFANIIAQKPMQPFVYKNPGVMATLGRNHAVAEIKSLKLQGPIAWAIWLFVHLMALVGFRNRLIVFINWAWNYFTYDRGLRLIIKE